MAEIEYMIDYTDFLDLAKNRRSTRRLKAGPVPKEDVAKILEATRWAPSGANTQPWQFIVVDDEGTRNRLLDAVDGIITVSTLRHVPVFIIVCGDTRARVLYPGGRHLSDVDKISVGDYEFDSHDDNLISSLSNAFLYMLLASTTLGLGTRYITSTKREPAASKIKEMLGIPDFLEIYDTVAIGYPESEPSPKKLKPLGDVVHYNEVDTARLPSDEEIIRLAEIVKKRFNL